MSVGKHTDVQGLVEEYREHMALLSADRGSNSRIEWGQLVGLLCECAEWTYPGAEHVVKLARDYGTFMLRNALALAIAAELEDGELGL